MEFRTPLTVTPHARPISHADRLLLLGSCFATEVGALLRRDGFNATVNPTGTLYNPLSIARALQFDRLTADQLFENQGLWRSWLHHTQFAAPDRLEALRRCNAATAEGQRAWQEATRVIVTFGTAYVFERHGAVVANCHKMPAAQFTRRRLSVEEIVATWRPIIDANPLKHFIFTVSPIRHKADGLHGNQLSKATLLMAIDALGADYFPAYEALIDDLRDYRFYAADMLHPSPVAVDYVYSLFADTYFTPATRAEALRARAASRAAGHRPLLSN
jgi:hypothetical protein